MLKQMISRVKQLTKSNVNLVQPYLQRWSFTWGCPGREEKMAHSGPHPYLRTYDFDWINKQKFRKLHNQPIALQDYLHDRYSKSNHVSNCLKMCLLYLMSYYLLILETMRGKTVLLIDFVT